MRTYSQSSLSAHTFPSPLDPAGVKSSQTGAWGIWARCYGQERYQTATAIADQLAEQFKIDYSKGQQFQAVVLASGNNWLDAVSG